MLKKPQGYDEAPAYTGESQQLPKGKYVCVIKMAEMQTKDGEDKLAVYYDIAEGEYEKFYEKVYKHRKAKGFKNEKSGKDAWPAIRYFNLDEKSLPWLKGFITSLETSNNFTFQWDKENNENTLKGKRFGGIFRREQFLADDGSRPFATRLYRIRSVAGLAEAEVPEDSLLPEQTGAGSRPTPADAEAPMFPADNDGFMNIPDGAGDEGVPFL